jgi:Ni,Fe-hydrogenase III component G
VAKLAGQCDSDWIVDLSVILTVDVSTPHLSGRTLASDRHNREVRGTVGVESIDAPGERRSGTRSPGLVVFGNQSM